MKNRELGLSIGYIEQILALLKRSGLAVGVRGVHGGFWLAKAASEITVYNILEAADENLAGVTRLREGGSLSGEFTDQTVWQGAGELLREYLSTITLEELRKGCSECSDCFHAEPEPEIWEIADGPGKATCWDT